MAFKSRCSRNPDVAIADCLAIGFAHRLVIGAHEIEMALRFQPGTPDKRNGRTGHNRNHIGGTGSGFYIRRGVDTLQSKTYVLGPVMAQIAALGQISGIVQAARSIMRELSEETGDRASAVARKRWFRFAPISFPEQTIFYRRKSPDVSLIIHFSTTKEILNTITSMKGAIFKHAHYLLQEGMRNAIYL